MDSFNWMYAFMVLMSSGTSNCIYAYAMERIFPAKDRRVYWTLQAILIMVAAVEKQLLPPAAVFAVGTVLLVVPTYACLRGSVVSKTAVTLVMELAMFVAEFPTSWLWIMMTGLPVMSFEIGAAHLGEYMAMVVVHALLMAVLCALIAWACKRLRVADRGRIKALASSSDRVFLLFLSVQGAIIFLQLMISTRIVDDAVAMLGLVVPLIFFIATDIVLFRAMRDQEAKAMADLRANLLQEQADGYLAAAQRMQQSLAEAAVLRHDLRNHMQVVEGLCERGEREEAQAYLGKAAHLL